MITGDYHHTAVAVAKDVGMVKPNSQVVVIDTVRHDHNHDHDKPLSGTPDSSPSIEAPPQPSPQVSFTAHTPASGAHVAPQDESSSIEDGNGAVVGGGGAGAGPRVLRWANSWTDPAAKPEKQVSGTANNQSPVSLGLPDSPIQRWQHSPSRLSSQMSTCKRQLSRVSSLTRLPREAASLTATAPEPSAASETNLSLSRQLFSRQKSLRSSNKLMQVSVAKLLLLPFQMDAGESTPATPHLLSLPECGSRGLTFTCGAGRQHVDPCDALTAMAEGSMQCAVTGDAFELLLQLREASLLETVLRNAVVFSRMQPHQKGQVMDLLGSRGVHQPNGGDTRHIQVGPYHHRRQQVPTWQPATAQVAGNSKPKP